ncbi:hypothetical protein ACFL0V_01385 [Nanoarchaeota archaeon]
MRTIRPVKRHVLSTEEAMAEAETGVESLLKYVQGVTYDEAVQKLQQNPGGNPVVDGRVRPLTFAETINELMSYDADYFREIMNCPGMGFNTCSTMCVTDENIEINLQNGLWFGRNPNGHVIKRNYARPVDYSPEEIITDPIFKVLAPISYLKEYYTEPVVVEWLDAGNFMVYGDRSAVEVCKSDDYTRFLVR